MTDTQLHATLELRDNATRSMRLVAGEEELEIVTGKPRARLLQCGDVVEHHGRRGTVRGFDLQDQDAELGPMFLIELDGGGEEIFARTCACRVLEEAPASGELVDDEQSRRDAEILAEEWDRR